MRIKLLFVISVSLLFGMSAWSKGDSLKLKKSKQIDRLIRQSRVKKSEFSVYIQSDKGGQSYELNSKKNFIPASLTKIITGAAVLEKMPPGKKFVTKIQSLEKPVNGVLKGPIYLTGDGDPGFVSESMWNLVNNFVRSGVKEVTGDIIINDYKFDDVRFDPSRDAGSRDRAYDSPIGAMAFNWSAVNVYARPGDKAGDPVQVFLDPQNEYFNLVNNAKTRKGKAKDIRVSLTRSTNKNSVENVIVNGGLGLQHGETVVFRAIDKPDIWAGHNLKSFLKRRGVSVKGTVRRAKPFGDQLVTLASVKSQPISKHVSDMLKYSNNYVAEILAKNLAAEYVKTPAVMEDGIQVLRDYLISIGLKDFNLVNPSGLSRANQFSVYHFYQILDHMKAKAMQHPEFLSGLAVAGVDGTVRSRMKQLGGKGHVRGKTGMLSGVVGFAGYIHNKDETLTFAMLYNGPKDKRYDGRVLIDKIVLALAD